VYLVRKKDSKRLQKGWEDKDEEREEKHKLGEGYNDS